MLTIYQSNSISTLKTWLVDILCGSPLNHPFIDEQILVQSPGMAQWLQQQIALSSGIAAAVSFPMPASFVWQLFQTLLPDVPETSAFSKEAMTWKIMHLLPDCLKDPAYAPLRHYLEYKDTATTRNDQTITQVKAYQLAAKIADTFDQYLVYRPKWVEAWEQNDNLEKITQHQTWQPLLWRKLTTYTHACQQSHWHRGNLYKALVSALDKSALGKVTNKSRTHMPSLPERLFIFGISTLPPAYIEVLQAISKHSNVYLMVHNPCQFYWGDIKRPASSSVTKQDDQLQFSEGFIQQGETALEEGNTLLSSMGKLGRDYHALLSDIEAFEEEQFVDPLDKHYTTGVSATTLAHIQSHILNLEEPDTPLVHAPEDDSLIINSCHSPLREVEVLHDYLLNLLDNNPLLTPKDIIIMAPDVETYSPAIQAVFSSVPFERAIPFAISDRNVRRENPMLEAFITLLNCQQLRCTINDIMTLLEVPAIMRRYGIEVHQLDTLRTWITDSGIRWGIDGEQQVRQSLPANYQNTWRFGLERLLLGYAIHGEQTLYENRLPAEDIEGLNAALCGPLLEFIDQLQWLSNILDKERTASEWAVLVNQVLDRFFLPDAQETPVLQMARDTLTSLCEQIENAGFEQPLTHPVVLEWLTERLENHKGSQRFLSGKVNVCTLMPMRSIPFKVICLLGMNDDAYPRSIPPGSFDLIAAFPRQGDRSRRDDDRYLFLEALLAAEEHFYISYNGRDIKDDSERTPSVLLSELIDYCKRNFKHPVDNTEIKWVTQHPLQPFSPDYFQADSPYFTYAKEWLPSSPTQSASSSTFLTTPLASREPLTTLELDELIRFYRHPCKYFFRQRLGVIFEELASLPEDSEPFAIQGLEDFRLHSMLLEQRLKGVALEETVAIIKASGRLPHSYFGKLTIQSMENTVTGMADAIKPYLIPEAQEQEIRLDIQGTQLTGWVKGIYNDILLRYRPSKNKHNLLVSCLIEHLAWCASSETPKETRVFYLKPPKKEVECTVLRPLPQQQSLDELHKLIDFFYQGQNKPLPFYPTVSSTWVQSKAIKGFQRTTNETALNKAWKEIKEALEKEYAKDDYLQRAWPDITPTLLEEITSLAEKLLLPLATHNTKYNE